MKRPHHMTMKELIELPVLDDESRFIQYRDHSDDDDGYGGAFQDDDGRVWGTLKLASGWVRYPAYLPLMA